MTEFHWIGHGGKVKDSQVTGASNFSEDTSNHKITVPAGKRWRLLYGVIYRDQNADLTIALKDSGDKMLNILTYAAAGTGWLNIWQATNYRANAPIILKAGDYVLVTFGAAQGAGGIINMRFLEYDV